MRWQVLAMRISHALRRLNRNEEPRDRVVGYLKRDFARHGDSEEFWRCVGWHLHQERSVGRREGADEAKYHIRPHWSGR